MKKAFFISLFLVINLVVVADDAFLGSRGGNVFPIIRSQSIQMIKEEIRITMEKDSCLVNCKFWFKNTKKQKETILMGFPDYFKNIAQNSTPLSHFTCSINGQVTKTEKRSQTTDVENIPELQAYEKWYCWNVAFNPEETVVVENSYKGVLGGSADGTCSFSYLIGTALTWHDPIGEGKVVFDFSRIASKAFVDMERKLPEGMERKILADSLVYTFKNYSPRWNETLSAHIFCFWKCPYGELTQQLKEFPFQNPDLIKSKSKADLKLMRNEVYARHGYIFKDAELKAYFGAQSWYKPNPSFKTEQLSEFEELFVKYIHQCEDSKM
jgi:hypothetical protein